MVKQLYSYYLSLVPAWWTFTLTKNNCHRPLIFLLR